MALSASIITSLVQVVELKGRLESLAPLKNHAFNFDEASRYIFHPSDIFSPSPPPPPFPPPYRLQVMVQAVYSERCQLRRAKVDLLASERDILLRIFRKVCHTQNHIHKYEVD